MNNRAFIAGYLYKNATSDGTFIPPTEDPAPQTDPKVTKVESMVKEKTIKDAAPQEYL